MTPSGLLIAHGSALILPMAVIEGPLVSILAGILAAQRYIAWYWALCLLVCGDVIGDLICYYVGRAGGPRLAWLGRRLGMRATVSPDLRRALTDNATRMLVVGKWTHSIGCVVLVGSGMVRLPLARFVAVNLLATIPKSAALLGVGYFAGQYYRTIEHHLASETLALCAVGVAAIALILRRGVANRIDGAGP